jgi:hypothetical protein
MQYEFPYRDQNKVLHVITVEAEDAEEALIKAVEELNAREDSS